MLIRTHPIKRIKHQTKPNDIFITTVENHNE